MASGLSNQVELSIWRPQDQETIPDLLTAAVETHYTANPGPAWFRWKFADSPFGPATVCYARSKKDGRIAGNVSFGLYRLQWQGRQILAAVSYETFVHPDFQRRGLFSRLLQAAQQHAIDRGIHLFFNFPNSNSRPGFAKAGWKDAGGLQSWVTTVNPVRLAAQLVKYRGGQDLVFVPNRIESVDTKLRDKLRLLSAGAESYRDSEVLSPVRTPEFLVWRFASYPKFEYQVVGGPELWAICRLGIRLGIQEAQIMEVFWHGKLSVLNLRRLVQQIGMVGNAEIVSFICTAGHPLTDRLVRTGFVRAPNHANFFTLAAKKTLPPLDVPTLWALATADLHTY